MVRGLDRQDVSGGAAAPPPSPPERSPGGAATPPVPARERLLALDVFRGLTVAGMLLVNDPGSWGAIYPPLQHAAWHGWTPTDLIFPFFLFIVGVTTHLSLSSRRALGANDSELVRQIVRRGVLIVALGLLANAFPFYPLERITAIRIPGVLQRIGVAYLVGALLTLRTTLKQQIVLLAVLLYGYWLAMTILPVPGQGLGGFWLDRAAATMAAYVDRALLAGHLWNQSVTWDPEGPLSTIPAIGTLICGVLAGRLLGTKRPLVDRIASLFAAGSLAMVQGLMWNWVFPINKNLWTSSYVVFTAGMAAVALATCLWLTAEQRVTWWTRPWVIFGKNPLIAFVGSAVMARTIYTLVTVTYHGTAMPLESALYRSLFASWLSPLNASLAFATAFVVLWFGILWVLDARGVIIKV
jgi:predicted acyltransferase